VSASRRRAEVIRVFERYLVEVVEKYDFCPWARVARDKGELAVDVVWGTPTVDAWVTAASELFTRPGIQVVMVIAPELSITAADLHGVRGEVAARIPTAGVAEFHPLATLDLGTPARLVPFVRRSPDPLLQLVPLALLDNVRATSPAAARAMQAQILGGRAAPPRQDAATRIAAANHTTVSAAYAEIAATLDSITADRAQAYAALGINASR
jgi:hypothetical protein